MLGNLTRFFRRNSIALAALFIALGGTSYAAVTLQKDSVGSKQIKNNAVRSAEVKDRSLLARDFKKGELPQGAQGLQGPQGEPGTGGGVTDAPAIRLLRGTASTQAFASGASAGGAGSGLIFPTTEYNNESLFTLGADEPTSGASTLVIPETGVYAITAEVIWVDPTLTSPANRDNGVGTRSLFLNGPQPGGVRAASTVPAVANSATRQVLSTTESFTQGDVIFLTATQDSGVSLNVRGSQNQVHFSATLLTQ